MVQVIAVVAFLLVLSVVGLLFVGARGAALRAGLDPDPISKRVVLLVGGWLASTAILAASGVLSNFEARPPRMMLILASSILLFAFATRGTTVRKLLAAMPPHWIVGLQSMRVPIELGLWALFLEARVPEHFTFEGRNFDVLVGATAPLVAFGLKRGWLGRRGLLVWNIASLGLLANIVGMAITTIPGPLRLPWPGPLPVIVATFPFVWLPTFLVPVALFGHILSLRQIALRRVTGVANGGRNDDHREQGNTGTRVMGRSADA